MRRLSAAFLFVLASCAQPAPEAPAALVQDPAAVRQAIETANATTVAAMVAGDVPGATANYAEDGVFLMPGMPVLKGRAAITEMFTGMAQQMKISDASMRTEEVIVAGDYAIERGSYRWTLTPTGAPAMPDSGKYMTVWQKQADGGWKIIRDMNNTDIAPKS
jgi:uncharacterized protein (TIGR02246 family)